MRRRPLGDLYLFLLDTSWHRLFLFILAVYLGANAFFALIYFIDGRGIEGAHGYGDAFFFSVQTMATIGYGKMTPNTVFTNAVVTLEALFGLVGTAMATGLMFAKFSRTRARVAFSRHAVINAQNGHASLVVRLANERDTALVDVTAKLLVVRREVTKTEISYRLHPLALVQAQSAIMGHTRLLTHPIDESSPLHGETAESLVASEAEIIASVVGIEETSGLTVHARHTYTAREVLFGKRFVDMLEPTPDGGQVVDYRRLDDVTDADDAGRDDAADAETS